MSQEIGESGMTFQEIISNGILERARILKEKRGIDRQRIQDMLSSSGVHPLERFPHEIWETILTEVQCPVDLGNLRVVHEAFEKMLEENKIRDILFPQILSFKINPFWKPKSVPRTWVPLRQQKCKEKSAFAEYLPLRQVSKTMRNVVDQWYENEIIRNVCSEKEIEMPSFRFRFKADEPDDSKLDGILSNFKSCTVNNPMRFSLRSLSVEIMGIHEGIQDFESDEEEEEEEMENGHKEAFVIFRDKVTKLLGIIGEQIWRFECYVIRLPFHDYCEMITFSEIYIALQKWVMLMPNLKWLVLNNGKECNPGSKKVSIPIQDYPFPKLEHLQRICFKYTRFNYEDMFPIFSTVLRANQQVRALSVTHCVNPWLNNIFYKESLCKLIKSLRLNLDVFSIDTKESHAVKFTSLQRSMKMNWPLKRMQLGFDMSTATLKSTFQFIENFPTLEHLNLHLVDAKFEEEVPLRLPNLTHLDLTLGWFVGMKFEPGTNFIFTLQFLIHSKNLKKLAWSWQSWDVTVWKLHCYLIARERKDEMLNFRGGIWDLRKSNVWDVFPNLDFIEVEMRTEEDRSLHEYHRGDRF